jgi:glc operon protein GlcG
MEIANMWKAAATLMSLVIAGAGSAAAVAGPATLTLDQARQIMHAAHAAARERQAPGGAVAIVDAGGHLIMLERLDGTFPAAPAIAAGKARTAALFRKATRDFEKLVNDGRTTMVALPDVTPFTPLQGGVPITVDGVVVGAIGISGAASAQQDDDIAQSAVDAFAGGAATAAVEHIEAPVLQRAFAKGAALVETSAYKVHASRRDGPGEAEVHERDTDVFYVLDGSARFVTGGVLESPRAIATGEIRGPSIRGGQARELHRGDVIVIPRGVPHWFENVSAPFVYFVVKAAD